jgi:hypothetical protein
MLVRGSRDPASQEQQQNRFPKPNAESRGRPSVLWRQSVDRLSGVLVAGVSAAAEPRLRRTYSGREHTLQGQQGPPRAPTWHTHSQQCSEAGPQPLDQQRVPTSWPVSCAWCCCMVSPMHACAHARHAHLRLPKGT